MLSKTRIRDIILASRCADFKSTFYYFTYFGTLSINFICQARSGINVIEFDNIQNRNYIIQVVNLLENMYLLQIYYGARVSRALNLSRMQVC